MTILETKKILEALKVLKTIAPKRTTFPILSHTKIDLYQSGINLHASDLELSATIKIGHLDRLLGSLTVNCTDFYNAVKTLSKNFEIKLEIKENKLFIQNLQLSGIDSDEYPTIFKQLKDPLSSFYFEENRQAIKDCLISVSQDQTRYNLNGININKHGFFVSTDGHRMNQRSIKRFLKESAFKSAIISPNFFKTLLSFKDLLSHIIVYSDYVEYRDHDIYIQSRLIDSDFPDCSQVLPKNYDIRLDEVDRDTLETLINQAILLVADKEKGIRLTIDKNLNKIFIESSSRDGSKFSDCMNSLHVSGIDQDKQLSIGINGSYVLDFLKTVKKSEKIQILITSRSGLGPIDFKGPKSDLDDHSIIMPMRL